MNTIKQRQDIDEEKKVKKRKGRYKEKPRE
jgi:hypothetical protein